jgi:hypothetical protein
MSWDDDNGNSSNEFLYGTSGNNSIPLSVLLVLLVLIGIGLWFLSQHKHSNDRKLLNYITQHHCQITGYMGGDQKKRAIYQCDDGQKLDFDLRKAALE